MVITAADLKSGCGNSRDPVTSERPWLWVCFAAEYQRSLAVLACVCLHTHTHTCHWCYRGGGSDFRLWQPSCWSPALRRRFRQVPDRNGESLPKETMSVVHVIVLHEREASLFRGDRLSGPQIPSEWWRGCPVGLAFCCFGREVWRPEAGKEAQITDSVEKRATGPWATRVGQPRAALSQPCLWLGRCEQSHCTTENGCSFVGTRSPEVADFSISLRCIPGTATRGRAGGKVRDAD